MPDQSGLAQYACDRCKQRKLRCSRETPKCDHCCGWSGPCVYSRHGRIRRKPRSNVLPKAGATITPDSSPSTGSNDLEAISKSSTPSQHLTPASELRGIDIFEEANQPDKPPETLLKDDYGQPFYLGPSTTASFLSQANKNIDHLKFNFIDQGYQTSTEESLFELSNSFAAINFDDSANVRTNVRTFRRSNEAFFIPKREEGLEMIKIFEDGIARGRPFFTPPPPDMLTKLAFEPSKIHERGWLLLFNAFVSTAVSIMKPLDTRLHRGLQWNTWMLMEDSSIFLEPSEVNIRALLLVASHGQDISTPSLCWTLSSHACQMAQTLALHLPNPAAPRSSDAYLQKNCLFWSLFILDKSLSLAFGRPPLLPGYLYKDVPPPDPNQLAKYRPHQDPDSTHCGAHTQLTHDGFGMFFIMQTRELANLQGNIQDSLHGSRRYNNPNIISLKRSLDLWIQNIRQSTFFFEEHLVNLEEQKAVRMGINFLTFQYYHLKVYLTRADRAYHQECLAAARSAISLLDTLVASSAQVFNGIVWQLLYQPFMPYFVIFANIVSNPNSVDCFADLQLLRKVVLYFLQMHNNHQSAKKLEKVAETFTRLAEAYVRHSMQSHGHSSHSSREYDVSDAQIQSYSISPGKNVEYPTISSDYPDFSSCPITQTPLQSPSPNGEAVFDFNDLNSDPMALLNLYSTSGSEFDSTSNFVGSPDANTTTLLDQARPHVQSGFPGDTEHQESSLIRGLENIAQNHGLDGSFDWFSWEQYDANMT